MHLGVLNRKTRNKQKNVEHNFIKYSYSYMFRLYRLIIIVKFIGH